MRKCWKHGRFLMRIFFRRKNSGKEFIAGIFARRCSVKRGNGALRRMPFLQQALSGNHPDIIRVVHEKPGSIGVEDIRAR